MIPHALRAPAEIRARIVVVDGEQRTPLSMRAPAVATVSHLAEADPLLASFASGLWVGSHHFPASTALADIPLYDGVEISTGPPAVDSDIVRELHGLSGARAGATMALVAGTELGSPQVGSVVTFDATAWLVAAPSRQEPSLAVVVHRPPRRQPADPGPFPEPPSEETTTRSSPALRWTMIVGPILMGGILVLLFRRWHFALFMLLSPFMALLNHVDGKWRSRAGRRADARRRRTDLEQFEKEVREWFQRQHAFLTATHPSMVEVSMRARNCDGGLWERRPNHPDFMHFFVGYGRPVVPPLDGDADCLARVMSVCARAPAIPVAIRLLGGTVVGVTGPPGQRRALARAIVTQLAVHHGPADLTVAASTDESSAASWTWLEWLPQFAEGSGSSDSMDLQQVSHLATGTNRRAVIVVDRSFSPHLAPGIRAACAAGVDVLMLADHPHLLPADTTSIVEVADGGFALSSGSGNGATSGTGVLVPSEVAEQSARSLARLSDPEFTGTGTALPGSVRLVDLVTDIGPDSIRRGWTNGTRFCAPIGVGPGGILSIDLVADGPHGLLAGTTGAGKSELLRTLVASLALHVDPARLNFVLIDYKGGSAFDVCAELPHVAGVVTDLDEQLAGRALTCLEAELRYREVVLRDAGVSDIKELADPAHLPRLLLVIDEFAALAAELPEFMDALVDMAARGRSLGVHLLLATQRPAGIVKDTIRANTNLRISLRVQDAADARDVVDDPAPALLPRSIPGRGVARFGPSELMEFQAAYVSGSGEDADAIELVPFGAASPMSTETAGAQPDLVGIVEAVRVAAAATGFRGPRQPWPDPLPAKVGLASLLQESDGIPYALADEPARQRRTPVGWDVTDGHALFFGLPGSGPEGAVEAVLRSMCAGETKARVFVLKHGSLSVPDATQIAEPVLPGDDERRHQLIRHLGRELEARKHRPADEQVFLVLDDIGDIQRVLEPYHLADDAAILAEILTKGHLHGIHVLATATSATAVRSKMIGSFTHRVAFSFADDTSYAALGVSPRLAPSPICGRGVHLATGLTLQVATDHTGVTATAGGTRPVVPVLPEHVDGAGLTADLIGGEWHVQFGVAEGDLSIASLSLAPHDHVFVCGPARSGKSTTLLTLARSLATADLDGYRVAVVPRRSPLEETAGLFTHVVTDPDQIGDLVRGLESATSDVTVFVDDAGMVEGFDELIRLRKAPIRMVVAVRMEDAGSLYGHWTRRVRQCRIGVLLDPLEGAGDLLGVRLPRPSRPLPPGRGYSVQNGQIGKVQVAG